MKSFETTFCDEGNELLKVMEVGADDLTIPAEPFIPIVPFTRDDTSPNTLLPRPHDR